MFVPFFSSRAASACAAATPGLPLSPINTGHDVQASTPCFVSRSSAGLFLRATSTSTSEVVMIEFEPGKLTEECSTHVPDLTAVGLKRRAAMLAMRPSEYLRDLVCIDVHGATYEDLMRQHRINARAALAASAHQAIDTTAPSMANMELHRA